MKYGKWLTCKEEKRFNPCAVSGHGHSAGSMPLKPLVGQDIMVGARSEVNLLSSWDQEVKGDRETGQEPE